MGVRAQRLRTELRLWLPLLRIAGRVPNSLSEFVPFAPCVVPLRLQLAYVSVPPAENPPKSFLSFSVVAKRVPHGLSI